MGIPTNMDINSLPYFIDDNGCVVFNQQEDKMEQFWNCWVEGTNGGRHYRHWSLESAQTEAERLARLTGKVVYIFECKGKCKVEQQPVKWEVPR